MDKYYSWLEILYKNKKCLLLSNFQIFQIFKNFIIIHPIISKSFSYQLKLTATREEDEDSLDKDLHIVIGAAEMIYKLVGS